MDADRFTRERQAGWDELATLMRQAGAKPQRLGSEALLRLGAEHALVLHAHVGMDEISPSGPTDVWEVREGAVHRWRVQPEEYRRTVLPPAVRMASAKLVPRVTSAAEMPPSKTSWSVPGTKLML